MFYSSYMCHLLNIIITYSTKKGEYCNIKAYFHTGTSSSTLHYFIMVDGKSFLGLDQVGSLGAVKIKKLPGWQGAAEKSSGWPSSWWACWSPLTYLCYPLLCTLLLLLQMQSLSFYVWKYLNCNLHIYQLCTCALSWWYLQMLLLVQVSKFFFSTLRTVISGWSLWLWGLWE